MPALSAFFFKKMTTTQYFWTVLLPGLGLLATAFWCGSQKSLFFAFTGFLACFLIAVTWFIEGTKKFRMLKKSGDSHSK